MMNLLVISFFIFQISSSITEDTFRPCSEISKEFKLPCKCSLGPTELLLNGNPSIYVNCDNVIFSNDIQSLPYGAPIVSFSQKWSGYQALPTQIFSSSSLPLKSLDFSNNALRKLTEGSLSNFRSTLMELRLSNNLLGDNLNPIFSTNEFHVLSQLKILDLSENKIRGIEEGIFGGCQSLSELYLDGNAMTTIPTSSLNGPKSLRLLSLQNNRIGDLKYDKTFESQENLETLILNNNFISIIDGGTFYGLKNLKNLNLSKNKLKKFNSDAFEGLENINGIDLSQNFIETFPTVALSNLEQLKYLNLSSNLIQTLNQQDLSPFINLNILDLNRNNIGNIGPGTFLNLKKLRKIDLSVNSLRTVEDDAFEGLNELEELNLKDNNILLIPASALGKLPKLTSLKLDYNRIAALSGDILHPLATQVKNLIISKNIIRELPQASFQYFQNLETLDMSRNLITNLNSNAFWGLENSLTSLDISKNKISVLSGNQLSLTKLRELNLYENEFTQLPNNTFNSLPSLSVLNISNNPLKSIPGDIFQKTISLEIVDLSYTSLKNLPTQLFNKLNSLKKIYLSHNFITELQSGVFMNLPNLTTIDLSNNNINNIRQGAFVNVMNIKHLILRNNNLNSFKGEIFNTGTSLEYLDISNNQLSYLYPSSFRIHPRLKKIFASNNKFNFFPAELIATLQYLEEINLSNNYLKNIDELDFAKLPKLRILNLSNNQIESISEMAFHNSTQLQILDLSNNHLERLGERTFEGFIRLKELNLGYNNFTNLPETIFDRTRIEMLENIILKNNKFIQPPFESLKKQYFFISYVDLSYNQIKDIPGEDSIMVNIKKLDLSFNPLTETSINNILGEPKTVRDLNLAGTGIIEIVRLETPFLNNLNLSYNKIEKLPDKVFDRTTLLENLDLSNNQITNITNLKLDSLKSLEILNISNNPISIFSEKNFENFEGDLKILNMNSLYECTRIEKGAFKYFTNLKSLNIFDYPKLGYIDINGILSKLTSLESINIETKDAAIGSDQFQSIIHPRLKELGIFGTRLRSISSGTFSGLKGEFMKIKLKNTSLTTLPPALFFAVPRSSKIDLDVTGSQLTTLTPQLLSSLDDRRGDLKILGLEHNPVVCDCGARALRRWLPQHMTSIKCTKPNYLAGKFLVDIPDDELTCGRKTTLTTTTSTKKYPTVTMKSIKFQSRTTEPEIIWSIAPTEKVKIKNKPTLNGQFTLNNEDTLIITIVGSVIAFIAILIIIICIIRLKMSSHTTTTTQLGPSMMAPGSSCACSVKGVPPVYSLSPTYATLPYKMQGMSTASTLRPSNYSTMGRMPYQQNTQPYLIHSYPPDDKIYR